jgi:hypothetical protein
VVARPSRVGFAGCVACLEGRSSSSSSSGRHSPTANRRCTIGPPCRYFDSLLEQSPRRNPARAGMRAWSTQSQLHPTHEAAAPLAQCCCPVARWPERDALGRALPGLASLP